jgi:hypothetical protein
VQATGAVLNVVLFHKAARVEAIDIPEGTEISASTGRWTEGGWEQDYEVLEQVPPSRKEVGKNEQGPAWLDLATAAEAAPLDPRDADWRDASLRIMSESIEVHRVKGVEFATDPFMVKRHRREKRDSIDV